MLFAFLAMHFSNNGEVLFLLRTLHSKNLFTVWRKKIEAVLVET